MIRFAVIGLGFAGKIHVKNILNCSDSKLVAVADADISQGQEYKKQNVTIYSDWRKLIAEVEVDAVVVSTPHDSHFEIASTLLKFGKHVLLEKPLATDAEQAEALIALAKESVSVMAVNITHCFYPPIIDAKRIIESGKLGIVIKVEDTMIFPIKENALKPWYFQKEVTGGGVAITNMIHMLARLSYLFDQPLKFVNGQAYRLYEWGDVEDTALMELKMNGDVPVYLHASWPKCDVESKFIEEVKIVGSKGILKLQAWEGYEFTAYDGKNLSHKPYDSHSSLEERIQLGMNNVLANFIQQILTEQKNIKMLEIVLCSQKIISAFYKKTIHSLEQRPSLMKTFFQ